MQLEEMLVQGKNFCTKFVQTIIIQPRLYKDKLERIFEKKRKEAQAQSQILAPLSDGNTTSDVNSDVFNSINAKSSDDESTNEMCSKFENLEVESSTSTLPFCECNLKMKLSTENIALCM